jgi:PPOX class probable F420-dependent enzyme
MIDFTRGFARRASARLRREYVVWLTTVDKSNRPQPRPVWFHWDGKTILVFSQTDAAKVRQIRRNPNVAISLNTDREGTGVTVILGRAKLLRRWPADERVKQYFRKYRQGIEEFAFTPGSFQSEYNTPIEITPTAVRGY